jgi:hypothetical protein
MQETGKGIFRVEELRVAISSTEKKNIRKTAARYGYK